MIVKTKIVPGAKKFKIELKNDENGSYMKIWVKSQPEKGKANKEILKELKKIFGDVKIVSGMASREKYIKMKHTIKEVEEIIGSGKNN
ncbi:MAG: YggU family protein [Candidatus Aenigmarchaeota archaeon]|nr:YggU family protein [Candidatus Aenigmarchaeota archaeon]